MNLNSYFLGANTPDGFFSLFNQLYNSDDDNTVYLIKGGPGTGKSSIMKRIASAAENHNLKVNRIPCSSDPYSLDAIIIPELKISFADATSPHIINPVYPGICEHTIDLSQYWNTDKLKANTSVIKRLTKENSAAHKKCIRFLKAASIVNEELSDILKSVYDEDKIQRFIKRFINTELKDIHTGECKSIFLSAVTPSGIIILYDSIINNNIIEIKDKHNYVSEIITKEINTYCESNHLKRTVCLSPINPDKKIDHIIFDNFTLFTSDKYNPSIKKSERVINTDRFIKKDEYNKVKNRIRFLDKSKTELIGESVKCLEDAKAIHDVLESYYIAAMDFSKVSEITDNIINELFT